MTYTVKPSEVYHPMTQERINLFLTRSGYKIVDFRPTKRGDSFLGVTYKEEPFIYQHPENSDEILINYGGSTQYDVLNKIPRLILQSKDSDYFIWE